MRLLPLLALLLAQASSPEPGEVVVKVTAERFFFTPSRIVLTRGVPVVLELESKDRTHGFSVTGLKIREEIKPGETTRVHLVPEKVGSFPFRCDIFCGKGHEDMEGEIVVVDQ
jgi:cytochrome c oxidase subunit 2